MAVLPISDVVDFMLLEINIYNDIYIYWWGFWYEQQRPSSKWPHTKQKGVSDKDSNYGNMDDVPASLTPNVQESMAEIFQDVQEYVNKSDFLLL